MNINLNFRYPHFELWDDGAWDGRDCPIAPLLARITAVTVPPMSDASWRGYSEPSSYRNKTGSMNVSALLNAWDDAGLYYEDREMAGVRWIAAIPKGIMTDSAQKRPALFVVRKTDYADKFWAMEMMEAYDAYNGAAVVEGFSVIYVASDDTIGANYLHMPMVMEAISIFPIDAAKIYLDVSAVEGDSITDLGGAVEGFGGLNIPVVNISKSWQNKNRTIDCHRNGNADYNPDAVKYSETGAKLAEGLYIEHSFSEIDDRFTDFLSGIGVKLECHHDKYGERFVSVVSSGEITDALPIVAVLQEVGDASDFLIVSAVAQYFEYVKLAAQGQLILVFFARETPKDNDALRDIAHEASVLYGGDLERFYVTGHSHNGHFAREFAYRNADIVAAVAPLGNYSGLPSPFESGEAVSVSDEKIAEMARIDMPLVNITGYTEAGAMFPFCSDAKGVLPGQEYMTPPSAKRRARTWQRRLRASNCPVKSIEDIYATAQSPNRVTRLLGIPADYVEVRFNDGFEQYVADIKNNDGAYHLRIIALQGMPHAIIPVMIRLSWEYMRRFSRNTATGKINDNN